MNIGIVGAGNIGGTLGRKWAEAGHDVTFGVRHPESKTVSSVGEGVRANVTSLSEAVTNAGVIAFAVPGASMAGTVAGLGTLLQDKTVVDATNNIGGDVVNSAEAIVATAPGIQYFRAFNTLGWELFDNPVVGGVQADMVFCGPDGPPRVTVEQLIADVGLRPVWLGDVGEADVVDGLLRVWIDLSRTRGTRRLAFKLLED